MLEGKQKIKHKRGRDDLLVTVLHGIQEEVALEQSLLGYDDVWYGIQVRVCSRLAVTGYGQHWHWSESKTAGIRGATCEPRG